MPNYVSNAIHHFHTVNKHRFYVFLNCVRAGIPVQGLLHDLSKYSPAEFFTGVKYYQGDHSPNVEERRTYGYSKAWIHHKGRNKHHFEYWFDNSPTAFAIVPVKMPLKYVIEMFCDRVAASKVYYGKDYDKTIPLQYYERHDHSSVMHPDTEKLIHSLLTMLAEKGERKTFRYIRKLKREQKY